MRHHILPTIAVLSLVIATTSACAQRSGQESRPAASRPARAEHRPQAPARPSLLVPGEERCLSNIRQVTFEGGRSGEGYFSPDMQMISFQSVRGDCPHYQIFIKRLDATLLRRISPGRGLTTCSYFHPDGKRILWASTHLDPTSYGPPPKDRAKRYVWEKHKGFDIFISDLEGKNVRRLTDTPGYDAEGGFSPDGKRIVFTSERDGDLEIYTMAADGSDVRRVTHAKGYDGGPFYSPDGKQICFRGFRDPKHPRQAQIYIIDADGSNERQITNIPATNWAPYWHPSGRFLVYCRNLPEDKALHSRNFELFLISPDGKKEVRITYERGADVLAVFSPDGRKLMWTSTRRHGTSQLYIADFTPPEEFRQGP